MMERAQIAAMQCLCQTAEMDAALATAFDGDLFEILVRVLALAGRLDRLAEFGRIPGVHTGSLDGLLSRENIHQLRPDIPAERFDLHGGKNCRDSEFLGSFCQ